MKESQEMQVWPLAQKDPLEEGRQPTPVFLPEESHGRRSLAGYSPQGRKESDKDRSNLAHSVYLVLSGQAVEHMSLTKISHWHNYFLRILS